MSYATAADVQARMLRTLTAGQLTLAAVRLGDVERKIRRRIPDLTARCTASADYTATVVSVEAEVVVRYLANPDGLASETDGNYSYTRTQALAGAGSLALTNDEWSLLASSQLHTIAPYLNPIPSSVFTDPFMDDDWNLWDPIW